MIVRTATAVIAAALLGGCAANTYCIGEQGYENAPSLPPIRAAEGLRVPESGSALRIPPPPPQAVAFGEIHKDAEGDDVVRCLDKPPEMPPPAIPREPAPAPAAPSAAPGETPAPAPDATPPAPAAPAPAPPADANGAEQPE